MEEREKTDTEYCIWTRFELDWKSEQKWNEESYSVWNNYNSRYSVFFFNFIFKLYKIVLVLPNIKMNLPQVYMCSPSWTWHE